MEKTINSEDLHREIVEMTDSYRQSQILTIGMKAPDFIADTTFGLAKMSDYSGKWLVFFSHPRGFYTCLYY